MGIVYALRTCSARGPAGSTIRVREGEAWAADDPFVALHPDLFAEQPDRVRRTAPVEQATAAPGEKRRRR